jgi:uncharacterized protein (DUF1499 family)
VCSFGAVWAQAVTPLIYNGSKETGLRVIREVLAARKDARVAAETEDYIHAVFTSRFFRFQDDVEFHAAEPGVIHVRSISRLGYHDFGVNRRRVESLHRAFAERLGIAWRGPSSTGTGTGKGNLPP